jgi:phosphatidylglycerophosphate synthase
MIFPNQFKKLPNQITLFRLLALPFLYYYAYSQKIYIFTILFLAAGISDTLDGIVARKFNMCSLFGSNFDQMVDDAIIASGIIFLFFLKRSIYNQNIVLLLILIILFIINRIIINLKFDWKVRLHTYAGKILERSYYVLLTLVLFLKNYKSFFYLLMLIAYYCVIEEIFIYLKFDTLDIKIKSFFHD